MNTTDTRKYCIKNTEPKIINKTTQAIRKVFILLLAIFSLKEVLHTNLTNSTAIEIIKTVFIIKPDVTGRRVREFLLINAKIIDENNQITESVTK